MRIEYNHNHEKTRAYEIIDSFLEELQDKYSDMISNPSKKWNAPKDKMDFSFNAKGFDIKGDIELTDKGIIFDGKLPFAARFFKGKIESMVREKLDELFV